MALLTCSLSAYSKDVGPEQILVTAVTGDVTYVRPSESNEPQAVTLFLKLEEGDQVHLAADASVNVLFIVRGVGGTWQGPKTLLVQGGEILSQVHGTWERDRPKLLKSLLFEPQKVLAESALVRLLGQLAGNTKTFLISREIPDDEAKNIEKTYGILRKGFGEDDATPDLYRLSVLAEYGQYHRMLPLLQDLLNVYRDNPVLLDWQQWVESRTSQ